MRTELSTRRALAIAFAVLLVLAPVVASADHRGHDRGRHQGWMHQECRRPDYRASTTIGTTVDLSSIDLVTSVTNSTGPSHTTTQA